MRKYVKKLLLIIVAFGLLFSITNVSSLYAVDDNATSTNGNEKDNFEAGETLGEDEVVTAMDEEGNVLPLETVENDMPETSNDSDDKNVAQARSTYSNSSVALVNFRTKGSSQYNTEYIEEGTNRSGYTNGYYAADGAFLGYDNESNPTKVKFMQAGVVGWVPISEVEVLQYTSSKVVTTSKYYVSNGRLYHGIVTNVSNSSYSNRLDCGPAPSYLKEGYDYYSYDGHYFYENSTYSSYATMLNDYRNNVRTNAVNSGSPYYNYFQYLSHRSKTSYSASQLNSAISSMVTASENSYGRTSKLRNLGQTFIDNQNAYGSNALLMIAVAANESAWGCSNIAATKNNLFGHAAYDSDPNGSSNAYSSVEYSVYYHAANFVSKGYLDPVTDSRYYGANVGDKASGMNVKYASDPYWGEKAAAVCWRIDNYLGGSDSSKYTLAIKDTNSINHTVIAIKNNPSSSSTTLYSTYPISSKTTYKNYAPSNYPFIIIGESGDYYKIQSDGAVNSSRLGILVQSAYDYNISYGYIPESSVSIVKQGTYTDSGQNTENTTGASSGKDSSEPHISYSANSQSVGWLETVTEPNTAGTTGRSLDLYQLKLSLSNVNDSVILSGKIYSNGSWINYNEISSSIDVGNNNQSMQLVNFTISNLSGYVLQYRVHSADIGWQDWVNQGNNAGTDGYNIQAIEFRLIRDATITIPTITYRTHVQDDGWQGYVEEGKTSGTTNQKKRLEAIEIKLDDNTYTGSIEYQTHIQDIGWQDWVEDGTVSGTEGQSKRLEAIKIKLTDELEENFDIYYRVHVQELGWMDWAKNGESAGTAGYSYRLEAIEIVIKLKGEKAPGSTDTPFKQHYVKYATHVQDIGWLGNVYDGNVSGTEGQSKRLEAITIKLDNPQYSGSIRYRTHIQDIGWQSWRADGAMAGTSGQSKRLEAIEIDLTGEMASHYDIYYRVHIQDIGWQSWVKNGETAGTTGQSKRLEAIEIVFVEKGGEAPKD